MRTTTHRRGLVALALAAATLLAGCSASDMSGGDSGGAEAADAPSNDMQVGDGEAPMSPDAPVQRQVIVTATAHLQVDDPADAAAQVVTLTTGAGGHVQTREEVAAAGETGAAWAYLVVRVPAAELEGVLDDLDGVGEVHSVTQTTEDVTGTVVDLDARIEALQTSVDRLLAIMAEASDTADLLEIETTLSQRQADLEALQSQRDALAEQVAMSTLTVELSVAPPTVAESRGGFLGGLESGWQALVAAASTALVVIGALLPWLVALGVPIAIVLVVVRRRRRDGATSA